MKKLKSVYVYTLTFLKAIVLIIILFLPFHLVSSQIKSEDLDYSIIKKVNYNDFKPKIGKEGGVLVRALSGDPKTFNPALAQETTSTAVIGYLFRGLTKTNVKTLLPEPDLAERWEHNKDGTVWKVYLKKGLKWSDGKPFTADDVVFTYNQIYYNPKIPTSVRDVLLVDGKPFKVKKIDDYTVEFILPKPFAFFLDSIGVEILPKHKLEKYVKNNSFLQAWSVNTNPKDLVGLGGYVIEKYSQGQYVLYRRNPYFEEKDSKGQKLPYITKIVSPIMSDPDYQLIKFLDGKIDYLSIRPIDLVEVIKKAKEKKNITIYNLGATPSTLFIVFNQNPNAPIPKYKLKWFRNTKFRQAISYAVNRRRIIKLVYNGFAYPIYTAITPANKRLYDEDFYPKYPFNLKKAKELLLSIGFKEGKDGYLYDKEGHRLEFTLMTNAGSKERELIGIIVKEDLKKIGIKVNFALVDFNKLVNDLTESYNWEGVIIGLTGSKTPYFGQNVWLSSGSLHMWYPRQKKPATDWEAKIDELFKKASTELDPDKRDMYYKEAFKIIGEQQPMIFLVAPETLLAINNRLKNVFPTVWGWYKEKMVYIEK